MSQKSIQTLWTAKQIELSRLVALEISGPKDFDSKRQANDYVRQLFTQYNDILKQLDEIYRILIHPQKRLIIHSLLDGIVGRLVELKQEMIKFDECEFTYFEDFAIDQNKTLDDLSIKIPGYFSEDRFTIIEQRNHMIKTILDRLEQMKTNSTVDNLFDPTMTSTYDQTHLMTLAAAMHILQAHERARQGRIHAYYMRQMKNELKTKEMSSMNDNHLEASCLVLQTIWRQKYAEKLYNRKKLEYTTLLGLTLPPRNPSSRTNDNSGDRKRRNQQVQHHLEFLNSSSYVKEKIHQIEETEVQSRIKHVLLQWLLESRQLYGQFPIYPSDELGGSIALLKENPIAEVQDFVDKQAQFLKNKKTKQKDQKKSANKIVKKSTKQKQITNHLEPSKFISIINNEIVLYKDYFYERDESYNKDQRYDILLAIDHYRPEVENEIRQNVDNILRRELIDLKLSIDNVEDKQIKKPKKRRTKKTKQLKAKNIIENRTIDSIFEELVETGIIIPIPSVRQEDFIGDYQYLSETMRHNEKEPMPSLLDCLQSVILQIVLPLCSRNVHLNIPLHRAVLLAGPHGSGKELLVHIACNELGALLLDLTPAKVIKSFNTVVGLKVLFAMIKRLIENMAPVVCMIHDTELLFSKKLTASEKACEPKRFKRILHKFIKKIKPGQRIMFVGISSRPYRARIKPLMQIYEHIILIPRPNYGSRRKFFYEILIEKYNMNVDDVELSILSSISNGFTMGQILETIEKVIVAKRNTKYSNKICTSDDFIRILGTKTPVFIDEENKTKDWYAKTVHGLQRLNAIAQASTTSTKTSSKFRSQI